jgi:DNA invertase Pin-like site-specific DNA recombinase
VHQDLQELTSVSSPSRINAAEYLRMSTEHQRYSIVNQGQAIRAYAHRRGLDVVATYADEGKSGLHFSNREGLQRLIHDVLTGRTVFQVILVYDVSRWGRFQDADESAYYEFICRHAGIEVAYCTEQFENDGSPVSTIVKSVKRAMAGEYSRELSVKVFIGQSRMVERGFRQGGYAGYGLRRILIDQQGQFKARLELGEQKSLQTDRVILGPGPKREIALVRKIYRWFIEEGLLERDIVARLNGGKIKSATGRLWTREMIQQVLTNEKYVGHNVYNRVSNKLGKSIVQNHPRTWVRKDDAFEGIIAPELFAKAAEITRARARPRNYSDNILIDSLRALYEDRGHLTRDLIDKSLATPCGSSYITRFGGLNEAYSLVGFSPARNYGYIAAKRRIRHLHPESLDQLEASIIRLGGVVARDRVTGVFTVNNEFTISMVMVACTAMKGRSGRWEIPPEGGKPADVRIVARLERQNCTVLDYYILPRIDASSAPGMLEDYNQIEFETYRFDTLDFLHGMVESSKLRVTA